MNFMEEVQLSLVVLFAGLIVVFAMLVFLTLIIKFYGNLIHGATGSKKENGEGKPAAPAAQPVPAAQAPAPAPAVEEGIPLEVVAAIAAAVESVYGENAAVTGVRRAPRAKRSPRSAWAAAGRLENTRPF